MPKFHRPRLILPLLAALPLTLAACSRQSPDGQGNSNPGSIPDNSGMGQAGGVGDNAPGASGVPAVDRYPASSGPGSTPGGAADYPPTGRP